MYTEADIKEVIKTFPEVSMNGHGFYPSLQEWEADRAKFYDSTSMARIVKAANFIANKFTKIQSFNRDHNSQVIAKHLTKSLDEYIYNGEAIIAMLTAGFKMTDDVYLNPYFNVSKRDIS
jgi:hypothetical protein